MIARTVESLLRRRIRTNPAAVLVGPRQSGKTTLARSFSGVYFDLEQPADRLRLDLQRDEALNKCLDNLDETVGRFHFLTVSAPSDEKWDEVRNVVICLDSIADVMRQALDAILMNGDDPATAFRPANDTEA